MGRSHNVYVLWVESQFFRQLSEINYLFLSPDYFQFFFADVDPMLL